MVSEITEVSEDEEAFCTLKTEAQKKKIRDIIEYQKSLYFSCSSSSSISSQSGSCSSYSSSRQSTLLDLMKEGSTSLKRLFDMEHTSLSKHFNEYSGSPIIKPILLWGSDIEDGTYEDPWRLIRRIGFGSGFGSGCDSGVSADKKSFVDGRSLRKHKLIRTRSFRRLPRFGLWLLRGFRLRFRLKRLKIMICGRKY